MTRAAVCVMVSMIDSWLLKQGLKKNESGESRRNESPKEIQYEYLVAGSIIAHPSSPAINSSYNTFLTIFCDPNPNFCSISVQYQNLIL
jgi:hypothetical protein